MQRRSFTLIEVLIVLCIFSLCGGALVYFKQKSAQEREFFSQVHTVAWTLNTASMLLQNYDVSSSIYFEEREHPLRMRWVLDKVPSAVQARVLKDFSSVQLQYIQKVDPPLEVLEYSSLGEKMPKGSMTLYSTKGLRARIIFPEILGKRVVVSHE